MTVTATDSLNASATITVTIHVTDVDEAPEAMEYVHSIVHDENDTDPRITLTATDPEDVSTILWSLLDNAGGDQDIPGEDGADNVGPDDIADRALFEVSAAGVLTFKDKPNFETDRSSSASGANEYKVVVQASDGSTMAPLSWFKVTVEVIDLEEEGSIKLRPTATQQEDATLLQPQVGVSITAHDLMDSDAIAGTPTYKWYRTSSRMATGTEIDGETALIYVPMGGADSDVGRYLRIVATYTDGGPTSGDKTATAVSEYKTIDQIFTNTAPEFPATSAARAVPEGTPKGTAIGTPITATDADSGEKLTYWLSSGTDAGNFDIDPRTGQLKVEEELDFEDAGNPDKEYEVTVNVADSSGTTSTQTNPMGTDTVMVTITVTNVDEKPTFSDTTGSSTIEVMEKETDLGEDAVDTYMATDPEGAVVTFTLSGDDGDKFELGDADPVNPATMVLAFEDEPDFEKPGDMNRDNVYEVTVVASDGANAAMRDVTVKVTNIGEDGKIEVMPTQPRVGVELTAELTESDGVVSGPTWQWYIQEAETLPTANRVDGDLPEAWEKIKDATSDSYTPVSDDNGDWLLVTVDYIDGFYDTTTMTFNRTVDLVLPGMVQGSSVNMAPEFDEGTTAMRYVPENLPGVSVGEQVMADDPDGDTLGYMLGGSDAGSFELSTDTDGQIMVKADAELDHETKPTYTVTVTATDPHNASDTITVTIHVTDVDEAPQIFEGTLMVQGPSSAEYAENRMDAVATYMASGTDADSARWSLSGDDMSAFTIRGGMLMFRATPDYENPTDMGRDNTYMVTVEANVVGNNAAMRTVTVTVTNEIELGTLMGETSIGYDETTGTAAVETYTADGTLTPTWSLSGDDADDFSIGGGMLTFAMSPNYEAPTDMGMDNMYMVTVMAEAGGEMDMMDVTVTVANVEDMGEVTLWASPTEALTMPPQVGDTITGAVMDEDGDVTGESWQWSRSMDMNSWMDIDGETNAAYMVTAGDTGYYLRVMATYTDAMGTDMAMESSMPTMMVGATVVVDEMGMVTLWAGTEELTMAPQVGDTITGLVVDPDGNVTGEMWQWARTMDTADMSSWMDIQGATNADYMVTADDTGYYLRVMATYMDAVGTDMAMEYSPATMMVIAADEDPLVARYDADNSGTIEKPEVLDAINDYLFDLGDPITKEDVIRLITLYLFG